MATRIGKFRRLASALLLLLFVPLFGATGNNRVDKTYPENTAGLWWTVAILETGVGRLYAGTAHEACVLQRLNFAPEAEQLPTKFASYNVAYCDWHFDGAVPLPVPVFLDCPENHDLVGGICRPKAASHPTCNGECGSAPKSGPPQFNIGNPININSGQKVDFEVDFQTADGLLQVERQYNSSPGNGWRLLLPGFLEMGGWESSDIHYVKRGGGIETFMTAWWTEEEDWNWAPQNSFGDKSNSVRNRISMVTPQTITRDAFRNESNIDPTIVADIRLEIANGEVIFFRRVNGGGDFSQTRRLVPVSHQKAGGYVIWYDYRDKEYQPYRVRDSFGRQLLLKWSDAQRPFKSLEYGDSKVITEIQLPDTTKLEYAYDYASSNFTTSKPQWAVDAGIDVHGPSEGKISVSIEGAKDRLISVTRRASNGTILHQRKYEYRYPYNPHAMTRVRDQTGAVLAQYSYGSGGLLTSSERAGGVNKYTFQHIDVSYDDGRDTEILRRVKGPLGRTDDFYLAVRGWLTKGEPTQITGIYSYDGTWTPASAVDGRQFHYYDSYLTRSFDPLGRVTQYDVESNFRRPNRIVEAADTTDARQTTLQWHPVWDLPTQVERDGLRVTTTYTDKANIASQTLTDTTTHDQPYATNGQSRTTTYKWGAGGQLLEVNGPRPVNTRGQDDVVRFAYDAAGNVTRMTNGLGHTTRFADYDKTGHPKKMVDANNVVTAFAYDPLGRAIEVRVKHPTNAKLDAVTTLTYDIEGRVTSIAASASGTMTMTYNLAGLLKSVAASNGERIDYEHDAMGNVVSQTIKRRDATSASQIKQTFDKMGRLLTQSLGPGRTWRYVYDSVGNVTRSVSPTNRSTTRSFDALNRLVTTVMPDGGAPTMAYDARDGLTHHSDAIGVKTQFVRNGFGEIIREISPDRGISTYYYDAAGDLTAAVDGRGQRIDYITDILGRPVQAKPRGRPSSDTITYVWDRSELTNNFVIGRLARVIGGDSYVDYSYDHRGNIVIKRQKTGTGGWAQLNFSYDLADRITQMTYPSGRLVSYSYNPLGQVTQVRTKASAAIAAWTNLASNMTYEAFGAMTGANYGNGLRMLQSWGNDDRLSRRRLIRARDNVALSDLSYLYDANDNIIAINDGVLPARSNQFAYDSVDRLIAKFAQQGPYAREDYIYDTNGNRLRVERRVAAKDTKPAQRDIYQIASGTNRLTGIVTPAATRSFTLDGRGNTSRETWSNKGAVTITYDGQGRLTAYGAGGASQTMVYNGEDERIRVVTQPAIGPSDTRIYIYDLDHRIVGEYGPRGAADQRAEYIWTLPQVGGAGAVGGDDGAGGYMPLAVAIGAKGTLNWVHGNHLGTPIVTSDGAGKAVRPSGYAVTGFPGQFANALQLAGAQHYYNRHRDYDPTTGRYFQGDPIGLNGDPNPYAYAGNNALKYVDPEGLWLDTFADAGFIGYDLFKLWNDNFRKDPCGDSLATNASALGADIAAAIIPGLTGAGLGVRSAKAAINVQKQAGHVRGTAQNANRIKQGKATSSFYGHGSGEMATRIAHERGTPVRGRPNVKEYDFGVGVGSGPNGGTQTRVRVHESPRTNKIHGHPSGPEKR
ncbi:MAG: hypothetical protein RLZZ157_152 [Pseudomonadota bacterium]|jgi:RHS repeat-associated protein